MSDKAKLRRAEAEIANLQVDCMNAYRLLRTRLATADPAANRTE